MELKTTLKKNTLIKLSFVFLVVGGLSVFAFKAQNDKAKLQLEKIALIKTLQKTKDSLETTITENIAVKSELLVEKQKIDNLIYAVNTANVNVEQLTKYKEQLTKLQKQVVFLKNENMHLAKEYQALKSHNDSTEVVLQSSLKNKAELEEKNVNIASMVKRSSKLVYANLKAFPQSGAFPTVKASKVNMIKINFVVLENRLSTTKKKEYFVQIIDQKDNVIGQKLSKKFGPMILDYSFSSSFDYDNEFVEVNSGISTSNLEKGEYIVNIFDQDQLVLKSKFELE
jgi:hypothetical protein